MAGERGAEAVEDLDDLLLDGVLDEFQKVELSTKASTSTGKSTSVKESGGFAGKHGGTLGQGLGLGLPDLKKKSSIRKGAASKGLASKTVGNRSSSKAKISSASDQRATLEKLRDETRQAVENIDSTKDEEALGDELVDNLVKQFEDLGSAEDMHGIMDTMMRQLLSKEVLHEPMKEIGERYPQWLQDNESRLSREDYARYAKQFELIKQLCTIYESTPEDFHKIVDLMQHMQDCGQPPSDIIRELAPGLELGEDGLPMISELVGAGGLPGIPGNCSVM